MKKILFIFIISILISGCMIANTPTSKVEAFLTRYQKLDGDINFALNRLIEDDNISNDIREEYKKIIEKQYKNLSYEIKNEQIDGNTSIVTTQIKVYNYKEILDQYNKENYTKKEYHNHILKSLKEQKNKINYTIEFKLNKSKDDNWGIIGLSTTEQEKLLGIN